MMGHYKYGERAFLAHMLQALICSWRGHRWRKDFKGNDRCHICLYSNVDSQNIPITVNEARK